MNDKNREYFENATEQLVGAREADQRTPPALPVGVMSWEQKRAPVVVFHVTDDDCLPEYPVKPEWMTQADWNSYQHWLTEEYSTASECDRDAAF